mmetsp:Transcript_19591/g.29673  ORF Transcript_19591/g.29673 Transcript_19591/m.29673 type:complete len:352 (-) Transcript_19591:42-1097(-)|eukprot:CAMPEP_0194107572 /NCGR_PEP_ID=MMETSP0150-20130528/7434_1 /TAXON_ID=122233 /ORGANISM="Chaetoceros debilis, Strain MM31A-1" /LENGTH=351 /DNA_ID=CAMNT_0038796027 /DNA_START=37 /DNA_END=1092 /DNA_ORIENTATION=-
MDFRLGEPKISAVVRGKAPATSMSFDESGAFLFVASQDSRLRIVDCLRGTDKPAFKLDRDGIKLVSSTHHNQSVLFSGGEKDKTQNVGQRHALNYLSLHDNKILRQFRGHSGEITDISMNPADDTFLTSSADRTIRLWNLQQAGSLATMDLPRRGPNGLTIDPHGIPSAAFDRTGLVFGVTAPLDANVGHVVNLYDARNYGSGAFAEMKVENATVLQSITNKMIRPDMAAELAKSTWTSMKFNKSGNQILVTTNKGLVLMVDGYDGKLTHTFICTNADGNPGTEPSAACWSSDDKTILCGNEDGSLFVYDATSGDTLRKMKGHVGRVGCIASNPKYQQIASSCTNTALWLW